MTRLDHLVVAADRLDEGVSYVQDLLGVNLPAAGGQHPLMGRHNRLLGLGGLYRGPGALTVPRAGQRL
jgi:hypothetical protein